MQPTFGKAKGTNKREENQKILDFFDYFFFSDESQSPVKVRSPLSISSS